MPTFKKRQRPRQPAGARLLLSILAGYSGQSLSFQLPVYQSRHKRPHQSCTYRAFPCDLHTTSSGGQLKTPEGSTQSDFNRPYPNVIISSDSPDTGWVDAASQYLSRYGVCALLAGPADVSAAARGIISAEICDGASNAAQERLAELHRRIESRGEDPNGADGEYRYLEVVCRDPGGNRFDMPVGWMADDVESDDAKCTRSSFDHPGMPVEREHENALEAFHSELDGIVSPVVQRLFDSYETGSDDPASMSVASAGFLINRPGSTAQKWHKDGPDQGFVDAFVPLIDVSAELGPTEVQIGTHTADQKGTREDNEEEPFIYCHENWKDMPYSVAPILKKGEILLLDYRTVHRGLGNSSPLTTRPLAYAVYKHEKSSDGDTAGDVRNFPAATTLEYD